MSEKNHDIIIAQIISLLNSYGFELSGDTPLELMERWLKLYSLQWIRLAVVEALYQGRYKAISVEHILNLWLRRGQATFHFNHEFERLICRHLPSYLSLSESRKIAEISLNNSEDQNLAIASQELPLNTTKNSIDRFIPLLTHSELYSKLRAFAHQDWDRGE